MVIVAVAAGAGAVAVLLVGLYMRKRRLGELPRSPPGSPKKLMWRSSNTPQPPANESPNMQSSNYAVKQHLSKAPKAEELPASPNIRHANMPTHYGSI